MIRVSKGILQNDFNVGVVYMYVPTIQIIQAPVTILHREKLKTQGRLALNIKLYVFAVRCIQIHILADFVH